MPPLPKPHTSWFLDTNNSQQARNIVRVRGVDGNVIEFWSGGCVRVLLHAQWYARDPVAVPTGKVELTIFPADPVPEPDPRKRPGTRRGEWPQARWKFEADRVCERVANELAPA